MRTVRATDNVFNGLRTIADREGIIIASVIERMLTFPCDVCSQPMFPASDEGFRAFMKGKTQAMKGWGHKVCLEKKEWGAIKAGSVLF